jgi:hypothetical protein
MPDPIPQQSTAPSNPPSKESTWQTIKRNIRPEIDSSRSALGPGHQFDFGPSPQEDGENLYNGTFGSPHQKAIGELRKILDDHGEHIPERHRTNFESFISRVSDDLLEAANKGRTKDGVPMTMPSRALTGAVGGALQIVPIAGKLGDATDFYVGKVLGKKTPKPAAKVPVPQNKTNTKLPEKERKQAMAGLG